MTEPSPAVPVAEHHAERLGGMLMRVRSILTHEIEKALAQAKVPLRITQVMVMLRLSHGPLTAGELARALAHDPGALTRLVDQLVQKGLVQRQPHETDRRALRIALTPKGQETYQQLQKIRLGVIERMLRDLTETERDQAMDYLQRMLDALHPNEIPS